MLQANTLLHLPLDPSTPSETPHPFPVSPSTISNYKLTIRRYGSQNIVGLQTPSLKRDSSIEGPVLTSPTNNTTRKNKKSLDFFSAALDDFKNAHRLSMSSLKNGGLSTRAGTMTSMSRTIKSTRTPQSFTSLANENLCFHQAVGERDNMYPVSSLNDVEARSNLKVNTMLSLTENGFVNSRNELGSINLTPGLEAMEFITEGASTQRSYRESEKPEKIVSSKNSLTQGPSRKQKTMSLFQKERVKSTSIVERNTQSKMKKTRSTQNKEAITVFDNKKLNLNLRPSHVTSENPSIQKSQILIQTPRADTIENIEERTQEITGTMTASFGRRGILARRLEAAKNNNGTKSVRCEKVFDCLASFGKKEHQIPEEKTQVGPNRDSMGQVKRPVSRRMKSEVQKPSNLLEIENFEYKVDQQIEEQKVCAENENPVKKLENLETIAIGQEDDQDVRKIDLGRRKRLEEWIRLKRKEEGQELCTEDLCEEDNIDKEQKSKFELFKQGGKTFFELNLENKFVQKYDFLRTRDENLVLNTEENCYERTLTENPGNSTLDKTTQKSLMTESLSKMSKSEKHVKFDPSTMMVRYFDEMNPVVIQPKFMESTGSMCVTELWGNKSKQDFYKVMRKPLQANTIFSLNPQPGIYRPEKPANSGDKYKRWINVQDSKENETKVSESLGGETPGYFSRKGRHTRAFVLQGTPDMRPKTGYHSRGLSSKLG